MCQSAPFDMCKLKSCSPTVCAAKLTLYCRSSLRQHPPHTHPTHSLSDSVIRLLDGWLVGFTWDRHASWKFRAITWTYVRVRSFIKESGTWIPHKTQTPTHVLPHPSLPACPLNWGGCCCVVVGKCSSSHSTHMWIPCTWNPSSIPLSRHVAYSSKWGNLLIAQRT